MHFVTLVPLTIPAITENEEENKKIEALIHELEEKASESQDDIVAKIYLERYSGLRSTFARAVDSELGTVMEPYGENSENYLKFFDITQNLHDRYEHGGEDFIRTPDGTFHPVYDQFIGSRFIIEDGKVYQKEAGRLHQRMRTKKAKKMKAFPRLPYKKLFRTLKEYAEQFLGHTYDEQNKGYGFYVNPNAFWDWYVIGGRWPRAFLVKEECTEFSIGDRDVAYFSDLPAPDGYKWVAAARKKDIEWEAMKKWKYDNAVEAYHRLKNVFDSGVAPADNYLELTEDGIKAFGDVLFYKDETLEQYIERKHVLSNCKFQADCNSYLFDDCCISIDELQDEEGRDKTEQWQEMVSDFIDDQEDDTVLVSVDCHI